MLCACSTCMCVFQVLRFHTTPPEGTLTWSPVRTDWEPEWSIAQAASTAHIKHTHTQAHRHAQVNAHTHTHIHNTPPRYHHQFTVKRCCSLAPCSAFSPIHSVCPLLRHIISAATSLWICEWSGTQIVTRSMLWITALMCFSSCVWVTRWQEGFGVMWKERSRVGAGCITQTFIFVTNRDVLVS